MSTKSISLTCGRDEYKTVAKVPEGLPLCKMNSELTATIPEAFPLALLRCGMKDSTVPCTDETGCGLSALRKRAFSSRSLQLTPVRIVYDTVLWHWSTSLTSFLSVTSRTELASRIILRMRTRESNAKIVRIHPFRNPTMTTICYSQVRWETGQCELSRYVMHGPWRDANRSAKSRPISRGWLLPYECWSYFRSIV